jgi:HlyD family secretion protein
MKRVLVIVVVLVCIGAVVYLVFSHRKKSEAAASPPKQVTPTRGRIENTVAASGSVISNLDVEIKCKASGTIISLPFDIGDSVASGDLIVQLDPSDEQRNVDLAKINLDQSLSRSQKTQENLASSERGLGTSRQQAQIDLEAAKAQADQAQTKADYTQSLFEQGFASQDEVNQAVTALATAKANLDSAQMKFRQLDNQEAALELMRRDVEMAAADVQASQINLATADQRLKDTTVFAPMSGYVTARYVQVGQIIASGISATTGGTPIMKLSDLSKIFVVAGVDESDIGRVQIGQMVNISVDAFPQEKFGGEVVRIARAGDTTQNVVTFKVRIEVTSENKGLLMPQMTADSTLVIAEAEDALQIPSNAVTVREGKSIVTVLAANGQSESREVVTGIDNGEFVQIVSGLTDHDIVVITNGGQASQWQRSSNQQQQQHGPPPGIMFGGPH